MWIQDCAGCGRGGQAVIQESTTARSPPPMELSIALMDLHFPGS